MNREDWPSWYPKYKGQIHYELEQCIEYMNPSQKIIIRKNRRPVTRPWILQFGNIKVRHKTFKRCLADADYYVRRLRRLRWMFDNWNNNGI